MKAFHRYLSICALFAGLVLLPQGLFGASRSLCLSQKGNDAIAACESILKVSPKDLDARYALADALTQKQDYERAKKVLEEGLALFPSDRLLKQKLAVTQSYLEERSWAAKRRKDQTATQQSSVDAKTKLEKIKCTKLKGQTALRACNAALESLPNDPALHRGKGDALLALNNLADAIKAYEKSLRLDPSNSEAKSRLAIAKKKRVAAVEECKTSEGSNGIALCSKALVRGAEDEFDILLRRGDLLRAAGDAQAALKDFESAKRLQPNSSVVNKKIAQLRPPAPSPKSNTDKKSAPKSEPVQASVGREAAEKEESSRGRIADEGARTTIAKSDHSEVTNLSATQAPSFEHLDTSSRPNQDVPTEDRGTLVDSRVVETPPSASNSGSAVTSSRGVPQQQASQAPTAYLALGSTPEESKPARVATQSAKNYSNAPIAPGVTY